jgi:hypothetical protein
MCVSIVTIISGLLIVILLVSEMIRYASIEVKTKLVVDTSRDAKLDINFNMTFPKLPCFCKFCENDNSSYYKQHLNSHVASSYEIVVSLDVMDAAGEHQVDVLHNIYRTRLDPFGSMIDIIQEQGF